MPGAVAREAQLEIAVGAGDVLVCRGLAFAARFLAGAVFDGEVLAAL